MPGFHVFHYFPGFAQTHVNWVDDAVQSSHPLSSPSPSPLNLSQHQGPFQWVGSSHQVAKYWSFNFGISPSNEYWGLISIRIDWFDLLTTWGTLKSVLQHHCVKASVLWCSDFFMNQLLHPYMTTGKTIVLTRQTFVDKEMSDPGSVQFSSVAQSCPTLRDPMNGSPPGSPVPGILQARTLEWVAISLSNAWKWKMKGKSLSWLLATPWTAAYQAPLSMWFSRQKYWSGVPLPSPLHTL